MLYITYFQNFQFLNSFWLVHFFFNFIHIFHSHSFIIWWISDSSHFMQIELLFLRMFKPSRPIRTLFLNFESFGMHSLVGLFECFEHRFIQLKEEVQFENVSVPSPNLDAICQILSDLGKNKKICEMNMKISIVMFFFWKIIRKMFFFSLNPWKKGQVFWGKTWPGFLCIRKWRTNWWIILRWKWTEFYLSTTNHWNVKNNQNIN